MCVGKRQQTVEMTTGILVAQTGGLAEMVASVAVVTDGATVVTHLYEMVIGDMTDRDTLLNCLDKGEVCHG